MHLNEPKFSPHEFPRQGVLATIALTIITLTFYLPFWQRRHSRIINRLLPDDPIGSWWFPLSIAVTILNFGMVIPEILSNDHRGVVALSNFINRIDIILIIVWAFKIRNRMNTLLEATKGSKTWYNGLLTFFLGVIYLQFKLNSLLDQTPPPEGAPVITKAETSNAKKAMIGLGCGCGGIMLAMTLTFLTFAVMAPASKPPRPGIELSDTERAFLVSKGFIEDVREIQLFASDGFISISEGGCFFTNDRLVSYREGDTHKMANIVQFTDILDIAHAPASGALDSPSIVVTRRDGTTFTFPITDVENSDQEFLVQVRKTWKASKVRPK
ncbi:DUF4234 domain-containing protein [bacterium AH-315-F18]|nr:DUF4234 domain-containing protein [bacterium AH-315-F18]